MQNGWFSTDGSPNTAYSYPAAGGLAAETAGIFYDATLGLPTGLSWGLASYVADTRYAYDAAGNTLSRPPANGQQHLSWAPQGHLGGVTDASGTTSFLYDADGNRLIRLDSSGTTMYLPGTELRVSAPTGRVTGTRHYSHAGQLGLCVPRRCELADVRSPRH